MSSRVAKTTRIGVIVVRLRVVHRDAVARKQHRALKDIERHVLSSYQATLLPTGEHQVTIAYHTAEELDHAVDDLLFKVAVEAQFNDCFSETEAWMEGSEQRW